MTGSDLEPVFARIPPLEGQDPGDFSISTLPGYTNRNLRLHNHRHDWVLRIPQTRTNRFIDRAAETNNQALACGLGIAPRPLWQDASGLALTPTLNAARNLTRADFADAVTLQSILAPIIKLHRSNHRFRGRVNLGQLLSRYYSMLAEPLQVEYRDRLRTATELIPRLEDRDAEYVPSHNDLVLENMLLDRGRVWLIDWEFSAMASPYWDLATLCNAANLDYRQSRRLLQLYCVGGELMEESMLFDYRNLLQLLGDCWMAALVD